MLTMDPDRDDTEVFSDSEDPFPPRPEEDEEKDGDDEEEDAQIFSAWMQRCHCGKQEEKTSEEEEEDERESEGARSDSRNSLEQVSRIRVDRRASLPCPSTLSSMQLSRLHSSTQAPVTARVLLRRSSSRRLLQPSPQEAAAPSPERRPSLITTIPEAMTPGRRGQFRRRNVMSLSDADSVCLICRHDLNRGLGGTRELQCTHAFHRECIEEWLWRKQSCPTCHVQVSMPQPVYWSSTRVKVP
ncbi:E3 ubiquitin-protein ligase CIP8-like [Solea senegalensis]|uniref:E3 ubiquitin-protein ligase CIP8-like n=1 Tax=Solea senegalensis TaxID=28829 RepID=A0AAV6RFB3_SOLSE|nr:E3 ubiquitin-protein ligase CIP8 [Solea senegalensis]KAG7503134.1 E3 ubiquitin-protein ligase CIP8-like [Solea senegalensis]